MQFGHHGLQRLHRPVTLPVPANGQPNWLSATTGTVNLTAVARTNPFDPAVTSTTGDVWVRSVKASAPYSPLTINPGRKGTITLTIKPNAPKGTVIHGFIDVDTFDPATASGDELAQIPYTYEVG